MRKIVFSDEQINEIITQYTIEHLSMRIIGENFGVSRNVITRILKENNISIQQHNHKYYAEYRKFQNIDSPEKAYWLGFIAADGCVYVRETNASVLINIHQKDIEHLEKFKKFMDSNVNITTFVQNEGFSNNTPMCKIVFNSVDMANDFIDKGIVPRKSLILDKPNIPEEYYLSYILGYFDGDGSLYQNSNGEFGLNIVGTKETLTWINDLLDISSSLEKRDLLSTKNTYYIRCGGTNKPYQIMKQLYDSCNVHLDRKYEIYKTLETVVLSRNVE